jgi:ACS family glucarate transporter-like MFS transporter
MTERAACHEGSMAGKHTSGAIGHGRVRYVVAFMLFAATTLNYADRASLSVVGPAIQSQLHIDPIALGYIFSVFGWAYVAAQLPGGWMLDQFGSRAVYAGSILLWSLFTLLQGVVGFLAGGALIVALFTLRLLVGLAERRPSRETAGSLPRGSRGVSVPPPSPSSILGSTLPP